MLHAEYHRALDAQTPQYLSRHYYDVVMLADTNEGKAAIKDAELLNQVAEHKSIYFPSAWASYATACVGTLRLSPRPERIADLRADYRDMAPMIFDVPVPPFDHLMTLIASLEKSINGT